MLCQGSILVCIKIQTLLSVNKMKWGFEYWFSRFLFSVCFCFYIFLYFFVSSDKKMIWNRWNFPHVFIFQLFKSNWSHFLFDFILIFLYNISYCHRLSTQQNWKHFPTWFPKLLFFCLLLLSREDTEYS